MLIFLSLSWNLDLQGDWVQSFCLHIITFLSDSLGTNRLGKQLDVNLEFWGVPLLQTPPLWTPWGPLLGRNKGRWIGTPCPEYRTLEISCEPCEWVCACKHRSSLDLWPNLPVELDSTLCLKNPFWSVVSWDTCWEDADLWLVWGLLISWVLGKMLSKNLCECLAKGQSLLHLFLIIFLPPAV